MGLFDKKVCDICGEKIGLLGNKKLSDGNLCKDCAKKLSPWFTEYKSATADDIRGQLEAREANRKALESFSATKIFGEFGAVLIDEPAKKFIAVADTGGSLFSTRKSVSSLGDVIDMNPDIIDFSQVTDVDIDIVQLEREEKRTVDGNQVSYDPPQFMYTYEFAAVIRTSHPYVPFMRIQLNSGAVQIHNEGRRLKNKIGLRLAEYLLDLPVRDVKTTAEIYDDNSLKAWLTRNPYAMPDYSYGFKCSARNWDEIQRYGCYLLMTKQIKDTLTGAGSGD